MGKTNTTSSKPTDPAITQAYNSQVIPQAESLASQPLQLYQGQTVAPLNSTQTSAIQGITNAQGIAQPYINAATTLAQQGTTPITTTPFSQAALNQYESPYENDVISSTQALENQQDTQQQQSLEGNLTAAGAWGGDRSAVIQSELGGQQALANNSTIAGLENQNYTQALGQFNTANALGVQTQQANDQNAEYGAYTLGSLGNEAENTALTGATAQLGAGTTEQNTAQAADTAAYNQYLQQEAYPYQSLDFLSSILGNTASSTGTTQTSPAASPISQIAGLGTAAIGLLKDGGRTHLAFGGQPTGPGTFFGTDSPTYLPGMGYVGGAAALTPSVTDIPSVSAPAAIPNASTGYVPAGPTGGGGLARAPSAPTQTPAQGAAEGQSLANLGDAAYNAITGTNSIQPVTVTPEVTASSGGGIFNDLANLFAKGGRIRLADGGTPDFDQVLADLSSQYGDNFQPAVPAQTSPQGATPLSLADTPPSWRAQATHTADNLPPASGQSLAGTLPQGGGLGSAQPPDANSTTWDDGTPVANDGSQDNSSQWGAGLGHPARVVPNVYQPTPDWRRALVTAGLAIAAGKSSHPLENVASGAQQGAAEYYDQLDKDNHPTVDNSGPTQFVRYADGTVVDTGIPTEAAINAQEMAKGRQATLAANMQYHNDQVANRANSIDVARISAGLPPLSGSYTAGNTGAGQGSTAAPAGGDIYSQFAAKMTPLENSTGNRGAQPIDPKTGQPMSSAVGNGQFIDSTWLSTIKAARPELAQTMSDQQLLALRADPAMSGEMTAVLAKQNGQQLAAAGAPVNLTTLGLAHRFGVQGAQAVIAAPPGTPLAKVLPAADITANPSLANMTADQYTQQLSSQLGSSPNPSQGQAPTVYGKFGNPVTIAIPDGKGGTTQMLAQQNTRTGQWVSADQNRTPIDSSGMKIVPTTMASSTQLTPQAIKDTAGQYLAGDHTVLTTLGYGNQGATNRALVRNEISNEMAQTKTTPQQVAETLAQFNRAAIAYSGAGVNGKTITAYNNFLQHTNVLRGLISAMGNGDVQALNAAKNAFEQQFGQTAPNSFQGVRDIVADEGTKAILGGAGALGDRDSFKATISRAGSPQQLNDILNQYQTLGAGQLYSQQVGYEHSTHLPDFETMLTPGAKQIYDNYKRSGAGQSQGGPQTGKFQNGKTYRDAHGNRATFNNGQWTPAP